MEFRRIKAYDLDCCIAEIYDQTEAQTEDVALLRRLLAAVPRPRPAPEGRMPLRILEPFCGNGRILIPLAQDGHTLVGLDRSAPMLASAHAKVEALPEEVRRRVTLRQVDVLSARWPSGCDVVILGGNCLYELATPEEQAACIRAAAGALRVDGYLYLDNNHMEGELAASWREPGVQHHRFPTGRCADGTLVCGTTETIGYDASRRLVRLRRTATITRPDGAVTRHAWVEQKHPPSTAEMRGWLEGHGFIIEALWGDRAGAPYTDDADRAIFWARRAATPLRR